MCGIVGYTGEKNCTDILLDCLSKLEYRGYDSAGIAMHLNGEIEVVKSEGRLENLCNKIKDYTSDLNSNCGIGHTRWATHGAPNDVNSHPHSSAQITLVHNGIIENYSSLKEHLTKHGYTFESDTDTEVLVKLIDYHYNKNPLENLIHALEQVRGSYAIAVLFKDLPDKIFCVRKESPLIVGYGENENFLASDIPAILKYTKKYSILEEGEIAVVSKNSIDIYNEFGDEIQKEILTVDWDMQAAEKAGFPHFMLKEIHEQPTALKNTINPRVENGICSLKNEGITDDFLNNINNIHIVACGTAMHAGIVGKYAIEQLSRVHCFVEIASEFRYKNPILQENDLVIILSQSGETLDSLAALNLAKERNIKTLAIVNVVGSSIARNADYVIYTHAGPEIAVASTKAYSVQMASMYVFAICLADAKNTKPKNELIHLTNMLQNAPQYVENMLLDCEDIQYLANRFMSCENMFFMGRGFDYALSLEASLKLKEISYIHCEAYAAGELKHGTISLIFNGTPVVALATQDSIFEKTISNVKEVKSRGARVILMCKESVNIPLDIFDYVIRVPSFEDFLMPLLCIIPMQLFAYYMSVLRGCDVDKPRNLAKSVTVE